MSASANFQELLLFVNGKKVIEKNPDPETTLLTYLRTKVGLTGPKLGCGEGGCGSCTVMVSDYNTSTQRISHFSINACLTPLCSLHGMAVTTVEGIGNTKIRLHPIQERLAKSHGVQCGFCTPGFVMSMYSLLRNQPHPSIKEVESVLDGNLCRCTGYRPILEGFRSLTKEGGCCNSQVSGQECCAEGSNGQREQQQQQPLFDSRDLLPYDPSQEPIFPPELMLNSEKLKGETVRFNGRRVLWIQPVTMRELLELKSQHQEAKVVVGSTKIAIDTRLRNMVYPVIISATNVSEMRRVEITPDGVTFGAACTLTLVDQVLKEQINNLPEWRVGVFSAIVEMLRWFGGQQIRNVASIGGNVLNGSPTADLTPLLMASGSILTIASLEGGERKVVLDNDLFLGYEENTLKPNEVLVSIKIPHTRKGEYFNGYKQSSRRKCDIAVVNAGMRVMFADNSDIIKELTLSYGGMGSTIITAKKAANKLIEKAWNQDMVASACLLLAEDLPLTPGAPGGMVEYRKILATSLFFKFYLFVLDKLRLNMPDFAGDVIPATHRSAFSQFTRDPSCGTQIFQNVDESQSFSDMIGRSVMHASAMKATTGEAIFCNDTPPILGELYAGVVFSTCAHAKILSIDKSAALQLEGVHSYIGYEDIPAHGNNVTGALVKDEEIFATDKVTCVGQVIGLVLADSHAMAQRAAKMVRVEYEELEHILTIEEAVKNKSYFGDVPLLTIDKGNIEQGFAGSDQFIEGQMTLSSQEHFYLETQTCRCLPKEDGSIEVLASAQALVFVQSAIAEALGIPCNKVVCKAKRLGGGFGGKDSRCNMLTVPVAVAANKVGRPVRAKLDRDEDMASTGGRVSYLTKYKVGFMNNGTLKSMDIETYGNQGHWEDVGRILIGKTISHLDNVYRIANIRARGFSCKTNLPANTALRALGGIQAAMFAENWMTDIALKCGISQEKVREINMYVDHDLTHYNQELYPCNIERCWQECREKSDLARRQKDVDLFNRENRWKKRGISMNPIKLSCSYDTSIKYMCQAGALVHVYTDGSVLLAHGGVEMGQGLHTKMIQIASRELQIPAHKIHIDETSTNTVPNTSGTNASAATELNGGAIKKACEELLERLKPYMEAKPKGSWEDWVRAAYFDRVSLSTTGFYRTPGMDYDFEKHCGRMYSYFVYGVACSEVEIDCLTGGHTLLRTDIVIDVGKSLNPAIDIGQIEGAFIQGYGFVTLEDLRWSPKGELLTKGPGMYKIPGCSDIPVEFNVSLLANAENPRAIYSSKGVGEPALLLGVSAFYAIKSAIRAARAESGLSAPFCMDCPATADRIRLACQDRFTAQFPPTEKGTYSPYFLRV